jgi:hypothetical protein
MNRIELESYERTRCDKRVAHRLAGLGALVVLAVGVPSGQARAEAGPSSEPPGWRGPAPSDAPSMRRWYGYEIVISDFFGASLLATGLLSYRPCSFTLTDNCNMSSSLVSAAVVVSGATVYAFGGPSLHAGHGQWGKAGASLALRLLPVAAGNVASDSVDTEGVIPLLVLGGMASAMVVDSAVLGYETVSTDASKVTLAPTYDPQSRSAALVMGGTF